MQRFEISMFRRLSNRRKCRQVAGDLARKLCVEAISGRRALRKTTREDFHETRVVVRLAWLERRASPQRSTQFLHCKSFLGHFCLEQVEDV